MRNKVAVLIVLMLVVCATGFTIPRRFVRIIIEVDGQIIEDGDYQENGYFFVNRKKEAQRLRNDGKTNDDIITRLFVGLDERLAQLGEDFLIPAVSASYTFQPDEKARFIYTSESSGRRLKLDKLEEDILSNISSKEIFISATLEEILPQETLEQIKEKTFLRSKFETNYQSSSPSRKHNIQRAAELINGCVLEPQQQFSFNTVVGERTLERGFQPAPIIFDGKFVEGVGGGVCQVSTTLYNSVLYAGLNVVKVSQHSLPVSYVAPSFDAMVSSRSDLVFVNDTTSPIFICAQANGAKLSFEIYGLKQQSIIQLQSKTLRTIPYVTEVISDAEAGVGETKVVRHGRVGIESEGYIVEMKNDGKIVSTKKIRHDVYAPQAELISEGTKQLGAVNTETADNRAVS